MNIALLEAYIDRFYGYGTWDSPLWFVGMEEDGCPTFGDFASRLEVWRARGCADLEDGPRYHADLGYTRWFGPQAKLQSTWEKLIRLFLGYIGEPATTEDVRRFQGLKFGSRDCGFASLELFPLPSVDTSTWIYREVRDLPFLINREVYKYYTYPRRAEELKRKMAIYKPRYVIIYGRQYRHEWEGIVSKEFEASAIEDVVETTFGETRVLVIPHPVSHGRMQSYWEDIGKKIKGPNQSVQPTPGSVTPRANE